VIVSLEHRDLISFSKSDASSRLRFVDDFHLRLNHIPKQLIRKKISNKMLFTRSILSWLLSSCQNSSGIAIIVMSEIAKTTIRLKRGNSEVFDSTIGRKGFLGSCFFQ